MTVIETEIWKPNPERPGTIIFDRQRVAQDIFNELEAHLETAGRMPDEYFLLDMDWRDGKLFPKDAEILCNVNFGGSEGIYLDIAVQYEKEVHEHSRQTGELGWHKRSVTEQFATGKTLGDSLDDLDRMNLVASSVTAAFYGDMSEVKARYMKITYEQQPVISAKTIYGDVQAGDWVIAAGNNDYAYLIGTVKEIVKHGTPEHEAETTNDADSVHVDFTAFDYPDERIAEIEERFSALYGETKTFGEIALDDVIMAPDMLIRMSHLGQDEIAFYGNFRANCESFCNCFKRSAEPQSEKHAELLARLERNLMDYHESLLGYGKREIIEMADKVAAMSEVHSYLCYRWFEDSELDFLMQFQSPLEAVADGWLEYNADFDDEMGCAFDNIMRHKDEWLDDYPLVGDCGLPADPAAELKSQETAEQAAEKTKPRTLAEKMQAANEKVKAQEAQVNNKSRKREERE